ncbi:bifunctional UDP-N-acetylglucosamine pyrophosphorylase/glucosamine-1-phosphate N-acetyltransferase [Rhodococcus sp. 27YEA15]|uniref:bifunctional UDP-N-acetylglucosamine diphosphorylase/glucosamine-1-phosphate N-acetyltransferase GlmU n=1 Tax=Rhodococcus sp. 27YEA15 TaxID=3156259 RepID=UPI003C7EB605
MQTAVIVLAAGAGTRMKSKTPKVLHTLAGRTMLGHSLHAAAALNPSHLVVVVGHDRERVTEAVVAVGEELGRSITITVQAEQKGTGHAVGCGLEGLPDDFDGTVLVTAADVPLLDGDTIADLLGRHTAEPAAAVTVLTSTATDPTGYGRILRTTDGEVNAIVEEKEATESQRSITEVNSGVYAFDHTNLRSALASLDTNNAQHEFYLTDVIKIARRAGKRVRAQHIADSYLVAGANDRVQLSNLAREKNRRILEAWMRAGVTIVDPSNTWIDCGVTLEQDVTLLPGVHLTGTTSVGEDAVIGPDTTLTDVTVGPRATVVRSHASESLIGADATVGPFAYLRPGTRLGEHGKLGAYVETKNADIGAHSKVPHLTYVGDATIGHHSNIGASSVFVNYDGVKKTRTVVGSHVRTGSDTMFIAPVRVGDGAYTGAGTVLRVDVPPGALAVSAGPQRNIEGWVAKNRPGTPAAAAAEPDSNDHHQIDQQVQKDGMNQ